MRKVGAKAVSLVMVTALSVTSLIGGNVARVNAGEGSNTSDKIVLTDKDLSSYYTKVNENTVSVHDPSIVVGYIDEDVYTASSKVYGTQNANNSRKEVYFIFGSHMAFAYSTDLVEWKTFTNNINREYNTLFAKEAAWSAIGNSSYDLSGNLWAPDIIYNPELGKWCMYMSVNGGNWNSSICMLTADSLNGDWTYVDTVIYSGFGKDARDYTKTDYKTVTGDTELPGRYTDNGDSWYFRYGAHAIDPCVFYDEEGKLYMSYGSWSGGIYIIELDENTGFRDNAVKYSFVSGKSDPYMGIKLGGSGASGEASYIEYIDGYYYLFLSYGGLVANGGYNMRVFRSTTPTGAYVDFAGTPALDGGATNGNIGTRLMSYYKWSWMDYGQVAQGHNSAFVDDDGQAYVIYHTRTNDGTEGHFVRTHQIYTTVNGGLVAAPFQYHTTDSRDVSKEAVTGDYEVIFQYNTNNSTLECNEGKAITLNAEGTVTGDVTGTWSVTNVGVNGEKNIELVLGGVKYEGVLLTQTMEGTNAQTLCFTTVGTNNVCLWGAKVPSDAVAVAASAQVMNTTQSLPSITFKNLELKSEAMYGATVSWTSDNEEVISSTGKYVAPAKDTDVTLSMVVTKGDYQYTRDYVVTAKAKMKGTEERYLVASYLTGETFDLSNGATMVFANPFNKEVNGVDISNGASIKFDVQFNGERILALSNIWGFLGGGKLYFTGGSYLGYNATGGYFDANLKNYGLVKDYIGKGVKTTIEVKFDENGYRVYANDMLAYSNDTLDDSVKAGTITNYGNVLSWLNYTATEFDLGTGNWWTDVFEGTISNIEFYAEPVASVGDADDEEAYYYYQNFTKNDKSEWSSANASGALVITRSDDAQYGNFLDFVAGSDSGNRSAVGNFAGMKEISGNYSISFDTKLTTGNIVDRSESELSIFGTDATKVSSNDLLADGYIVKISNNYTADGAGKWHINGSESTYAIPAGAWVNVTAHVNVEDKTAEVVITNKADGSEIFNGTVAINGEGKLAGVRMLRGRGAGTEAIDNIKVYEYKNEPAKISDDDEATEEVIGYVDEKDFVVEDANLPTIDCTGWWAAHSEGIKVTETPVKITFHTQTYADATLNWNSPIFVVYSADAQFQGGAGILDTAGYREYFVGRSDAYGWIGNNNTGSGLPEGYTFSAEFKDWTDWASWLAANKEGVDVTVTAQIIDGKAVFTTANTGVVETFAIPVDTTKDTYVSVSGELCKITNLKYGYEAVKEYPVNDTVDVDAFWSAHSAGIEITEDIKTITYHTQSHADATLNWHTPNYVFYSADENKVNGAGYIEKFVLRSDAYGWIGNDNTNGTLPAGYVFTPDFTNLGTWESWFAANKEGVDVTATVQLVGSNVEFTTNNNGLVLKMIVPVDTTKTNYVSLGGEFCCITDIKYTVAKKTVVQEAAPTNKLDASDIEVAFDEVEEGYASANKTFTVTNNNDEEITGLNVAVEGNKFTAAIDKTTLAPGESATVTVTSVSGLTASATEHYGKVVVTSDNARTVTVKATLLVTKGYTEKVEEPEEDPEEDPENPGKDPEEDDSESQTPVGEGITIVSTSTSERTYSTVLAGAQSLTGTAWWDGKEVGKDYVLTANTSLVLSIKVNEAPGGYAAFSVEAFDADGKFITTGSDKNAWYFDATGDDITGVAAVFDSTIQEGKTYKVVVKNSGKNFTITYYNEDGSVYNEFKANNTNITLPVSVHVMAQVGTFTVNEVVEYVEKTTTTIYSDGSKKITVVTTGSDGSKTSKTTYIDKFGNESTEVVEEETTKGEEVAAPQEVVKDNTTTNNNGGTVLTPDESATDGKLVLEESYKLDDVDASGWWVAHTKAVPITEKLTKISFHGKSYASAKSNWNTPIYVIFAADEQFQGGAGILDTKGYKEYIVTRSDSYCWEPSGTNNLSEGGLAAGYSFTSEFIDFADWETWLAHNLTGVDCELTVRKIGNYVVATLSNDGVVSKTIIDVSKESKDLYIALSGELTVLSDINVEVFTVEASGDGEELIPGTSDVTTDKDETSKDGNGSNDSKDEKGDAEGNGDSLEASAASNGVQPWVFVVIALAVAVLLGGGATVVIRRKRVVKK